MEELQVGTPTGTELANLTTMLDGLTTLVPESDIEEVMQQAVTELGSQLISHYKEFNRLIELGIVRA